MHADIHLALHRLTAAELHGAVAAAPATPSAQVAPAAPAESIRVQVGWKLVEFGLRLALPGHARAASLAA
ncbi:hypothetical protein ACIGO8_16685 [Streptomyces sp. NPDC053493]|uniref:hypothetical protein n=1 Tax=Streptomyces sp. NPDC053493 TaxID=3365705 RepID=UPI0037CDE9C1